VTSPAREADRLGNGPILLIAAAIAIGALLVNPGYYGDAPQYAMDVLGPLLFPRLDYGFDSGHLVWRPLLRGIAAMMSLAGITVDGLRVLQVASAFAMGCVVVGVLRLAAKFGMNRRQQLLVAAVLAGTSSTILVGGSGAPYTAMASLIVLAVILVTPLPVWNWRRGLVAAGCMGASWAFWGVGVMLLPAFCVAVYLGRGGSFRDRAVAAVGLGTLAGSISILIAIAAWFVWVRPHDLGFMAWIGTASHGAESAPSFIGAARAVLGSLRALIDLGDLGYAVKAFLLTREAGTRLLALISAGLLAALVATAFLLTMRGTWRLARQHQRLAQAGVIGLAAWLPSFLFTVSYGGNEVHMIFGAVPFIALALVAGLEAVSPRLAPAFAIVLWVANLGMLFSPVAVANRRDRQGVGSAARAHLPAYSALIVTGQDFIYSESLPILLRDSIRVVNVRSDVLMHGPENWQQRLDSSIAVSRHLGGRVAVLSDLVGEATASGLKRLEGEDAEISMDALSAYFEGWERKESWSAGRYRFVEVVPDSFAAGVSRAMRTPTSPVIARAVTGTLPRH
jgi:hypothetical protein